MRSIPCLYMRGGTSKGPFFLAGHLPRDPEQMDAHLIRIMGAGHPLQIDGMGAGNPVTSKVAIVSPSRRPNCDVDYLFAQVLVDEQRVDRQPNCGNMLSAVGAFAIERGLLVPSADETTISIFNVNTGSQIDAVIQTPQGRVRYDGDTRIDGVPGTAAPVHLRFTDAIGSKTGKLLPTGVAAETIDGVTVSCVDMAMPMVFVAAADLGVYGAETPAALDGNVPLKARLERIRVEAGRRMGLGDVTRKVIPKIAMVAPPRSGGALMARYFMPWSCHSAYATTGGVCTAAAAIIPGTVVSSLALVPPEGDFAFELEHPQGFMGVAVRRDASGLPKDASVIRTARLMFSGLIHYEEP